MEVMERPKNKVSEMSTDEIVHLYVQTRDLKSQGQKAWDTRKAKLDGVLDKLGAVLLQRYSAAGIESARTQYGTAYKHREFRANIADHDSIKQQVANGAWELVTLMPNKAGIKQYIAEHGDVPPGINWSEEVVIRVNRA